MAVRKTKGSGTRTLKSKAQQYIEGLEDGVIELTGEYVDLGLEVAIVRLECVGGSEKALQCRQDHTLFNLWLPRSQVQFCDATYAPSGPFNRSDNPVRLALAVPMWLVWQHNLLHARPGIDPSPRLPDPELVGAQRRRSASREALRLPPETKAALAGLPVPPEVAEELRNLKPGHVLRAGPIEVPIDVEAAKRSAEAMEHERFKAMIDLERAQPSACAALPDVRRDRRRGVQIEDEATLADLLCAEAE